MIGVKRVLYNEDRSLMIYVWGTTSYTVDRNGKIICSYPVMLNDAPRVGDNKAHTWKMCVVSRHLKDDQIWKEIDKIKKSD
jgi:hypothetical protein